MLGSVASIINSQCGRGKNDVSAFESVYGQLLDHPLPCSKAEARRCWTIQDRMLVTNEPEFDNYCKDTYVIDDDAGISEVADEGYFSEDDLRNCTEEAWLSWSSHAVLSENAGGE